MISPANLALETLMITHDLDMLTCKVPMTGLGPNLHQGYLLCSSLPSDHLLIHKFHCTILMKGLVYQNTEGKGSVGSGFISYKPGNGHKEEKFTSFFVPCVEAPFLF